MPPASTPHDPHQAPPAHWPHPALSEEALAVRRHPVVSSFISSLGYDAAKKWLVISFKSGMLYVYMGVAKEVYEKMLAATSKGRFYNKVIRHHFAVAEAGLRSGREEVRSTAIRAIGYHDQDQVLEIEFGAGDVYRYPGVPKSVFQDLERSPSPGTYFNRYIRELYAHEGEEFADAAEDLDLEDILAPPKTKDSKPRPKALAEG